MILPRPLWPSLTTAPPLVAAAAAVRSAAARMAATVTETAVRRTADAFDLRWMVVRDITPPLVAWCLLSARDQDRVGCRWPPHGEAVRYSVKYPGPGGLQGAGELGARTDLELPEDGAEMSLDRVLGDEEC